MAWEDDEPLWGEVDGPEFADCVYCGNDADPELKVCAECAEDFAT